MNRTTPPEDDLPSVPARLAGNGTRRAGSDESAAGHEDARSVGTAGHSRGFDAHEPSVHDVVTATSDACTATHVEAQRLVEESGGRSVHDATVGATTAQSLVD